MTWNDNSMYSSHKEVLMLLPWYVNKSLDETQQSLVHKHLKVCVQCRAEWVNLQKLSESMKRPEIMDMTANASFVRFKELISDRPGSREMKLSESAKLPGLGGHKWYLNINSRVTSRVFTGIVGGILLFIAFSLFFLWNRNHLPETLAPVYRTLGEPDANSRVGHHDIRVVFAKGLESSQIEKILGVIDGKIVADHRREGVYRIRISNSRDDVQKAFDAISTLRKRSDVIFAEPAFTLSSRDELK